MGPLEKENHLPRFIIFRFYVKLRGCIWLCSSSEAIRLFLTKNSSKFSFGFFFSTPFYYHSEGETISPTNWRKKWSIQVLLLISLYQQIHFLNEEIFPNSFLFEPYSIIISAHFNHPTHGTTSAIAASAWKLGPSTGRKTVSSASFSASWGSEAWQNHVSRSFRSSFKDEHLGVSKNRGVSPKMDGL